MLNNYFSRRVVFMLFNLFLFFSLSGQSPYELNWKKDAILLGLGVAGQSVAVFIYTDDKGLTEQEIGNLDKNDINRFDRIATEYYSADARFTSDILLGSSFAIPFLFLAKKQIRYEFLDLGVMTAEVVLINGFTTVITKEISRRSRPFVYNPGVSLERKMNFNARTSFYSGHTSAVSSMSFFGAKVFSDYFPDSKWKPVVWTVAATIPAVTGYMRVRGGKHFPTDVITGYIAGGLVGYLIPHFHKRKKKEDKVGFSIYPGINSVGFSMTW